MQAEASPVIDRQIQCVLKHWQDLEMGKAASSAEANGLNDQQDDDIHDAHTGAADGLHEAESIHSWGMTKSPSLLHTRGFAHVGKASFIHLLTALHFHGHTELSLHS